MSIKELENLTYTEYIDYNNAYKIVQNWEDIFKALPKKRQTKITNSYSDPLINLKKIIKNKSNVLHTKYNFSKNLKTYGRLFASSVSLQSMPREIRNALAFGKYYDIDMKNAHPVLLAQYCKKNNIRCDIVDKYIANREDILNEISKQNNITLEEGKFVILSILNGGVCEDIKGEFIDLFKKEMKDIHNMMCKINIEEYKKVKSRKDWNKEGTLVNVILCKLEHQLLMNAVYFMRSKGYNVDALVFDGFMVRKGELKIDEDILKELENYIKEKTEYNMLFVDKSITNIIDMSKYPDPIEEIKDNSKYLKDKEEFEKNHIKILHPQMYLSNLINNKLMDYQSETKIVASYKHLKTEIMCTDKQELKTVPFIIYWLNDPHIRLYNSLVFVPKGGEYDREDYNTWREFTNENIDLPKGYEQDSNPYVMRYKEFVNKLFNNKEDQASYFNAWCANIIQRPAERSCICIVLYSLEEGTGKNMITKTIEKCIGSSYVNYISDVSNQLFGKHSAAELNKLLVVLNEVKGKDTYTNTDLFKTRITDDKREVELKGKDAFEMRNYASYIINTNNLNAVNAGEKDRRFCVLECINPEINNKLYFSKYEKEINNNPEAIRCIYEYLKNFNIESVVPDYIFADARPMTDIYDELRACNTIKEWDFLEYYIKNNVDYEKGMQLHRVFMNDVWKKYKYYCNETNNDINKLTSKRFHYIFSQLIIKQLNTKPDYIDSIKKERDNDTRYYLMDLEKLNKYFESRI